MWITSKDVAEASEVAGLGQEVPPLGPEYGPEPEPLGPAYTITEPLPYVRPSPKFDPARAVRGKLMIKPSLILVGIGLFALVAFLFLKRRK